MSLQHDSRQRLADLEARGLLRRPRTVEGQQGATLLVDGRELLCFSSNNYLGFANHAELIAAGTRAMQESGAGAGASRLISGNMAAHEAAEVALAAYVQQPAARLFSTGYAANVGALQALAEPGDVLYSDALNHASLIDGCRLSRARVERYHHTDLDHLRHLLRSNRGSARRAFIVTDALFSMDGDVAPLPALRALADEFDAALYVDEAHSVGVLGPSGRGACAAADVRPDVLVGTLGKAFGLAGAFAASDGDTAQWLYNRARSFVFSTGPQPSLAAQVVAAVPLVESADAERARLVRHSERLRAHLRALGHQVPSLATPIVPLLLGSEARALEAAAGLMNRGIFVPAIRPPTVPVGTARLRIVPTAAHTDAQLDALMSALEGTRP
ncbi:MAG: 8-amino-7-oxononanoate synthase [Myxococcales bacterium]|nr:8-amino-7-oxononanoate synthase [Myxococcales bacterium]MCB9629594.1 8-amino-7-oxononanoate synthase [Sandaracinaceae bacterium]